MTTTLGKRKITAKLSPLGKKKRIEEGLHTAYAELLGKWILKHGVEIPLTSMVQGSHRPIFKSSLDRTGEALKNAGRGGKTEEFFTDETYISPAGNGYLVSFLKSSNYCEFSLICFSVCS
jgi:hypothetical protein